jgi:CO/xanthine dehydrogenase Mo-binding subunit
VAPTVASSVFAATCVRVRSFPIRPDALRAKMIGSEFEQYLAWG